MPGTRDGRAEWSGLVGARDLICLPGLSDVTVGDTEATAGAAEQIIDGRCPTKSALIMEARSGLTDLAPERLPCDTHEAVRVHKRRVATMFASRNEQLVPTWWRKPKAIPTWPRTSEVGSSLLTGPQRPNVDE
jgi:hypothetical protein